MPFLVLTSYLLQCLERLTKDLLPISFLKGHHYIKRLSRCNFLIGRKKKEAREEEEAKALVLSLQLQCLWHRPFLRPRSSPSSSSNQADFGTRLSHVKNHGSTTQILACAGATVLFFLSLERTLVKIAQCGKSPKIVPSLLVIINQSLAAVCVSKDYMHTCAALKGLLPTKYH